MKNKKIIIALAIVLLSPLSIFCQNNGFKIYIESWDRISFENPRIVEGEYSKMHSKEEASSIIIQNKQLNDGITHVILGKNIHINKKGFESEIDEIQNWVVGFGIKHIIFHLAMSDTEPPTVREYHNGEISKSQQKN